MVWLLGPRDGLEDVAAGGGWRCGSEVWVSAGAVNGELMQRVIAARSHAEGLTHEEVKRKHYTDKASLRRWVEPEEVADAALFLASPESAAITGERLRVDAGRF